MKCENCKIELPSNAKFCPECGTPVPKQVGIKVDQEVDTVRGDVTGIAAADGAMAHGFDASVNQDIGTVESEGTVVGAVFGGTGGDVNVGGEHVHGDQVGGDKIGGDKTTIGDVQGENVAIAAGLDAQAQAKTGLDAEELDKLFSAIYKQIEERFEDPDVEKEEITQTVQNIKQEAVKGEDANPNKVERWLKTLAIMAPDILEVTAATLVNPIAGVATVIRKVAEKAQAEASAT